MDINSERASKKKRDLLFAASQVFNDKGYHDATIEDIAEKLQQTKGSIYYYVKGKQDLLFECNKLALEILNIKLDQIVNTSVGPVEKLHGAIKMHIKIAIEEFLLISTALQLEFALEKNYKRQIIVLRDSYEQKLMSILEEGIEKSVFKEMDPKIILFIIVGAMNWMKHWYSKSGRLNQDQISDMFCDYLILPLLKQ